MHYIHAVFYLRIAIPLQALRVTGDWDFYLPQNISVSGRKDYVNEKCRLHDREQSPQPLGRSAPTNCVTANPNYVIGLCLYPFGVPEVRIVVWRTAWGWRLVRRNTSD